MWNANGILIQGLNDKTNFIKNFTYLGMNAYYQFPLTYFNDIESRKLTNEQQSKRIAENQYVSLEFISDMDFYEKYIKRCHDLKISIRALFIESEYLDEAWKGPLPHMKFLGYEYCPIPVDEQIITDLDWYKPFSKYWNRFNCYGLFDTYDEVKKFVDDYNQAFLSGEIGDGEMDAYICRVSQISF